MLRVFGKVNNDGSEFSIGATAINFENTKNYGSGFNIWARARLLGYANIEGSEFKTGALTKTFRNANNDGSIFTTKPDYMLLNKQTIKC